MLNLTFCSGLMLPCKIDFKRASLYPPIGSYVEVLRQPAAYQVGWGEVSVYRRSSFRSFKIIEAEVID